MKKRLLSLVLTAAMVLPILPVTVQAADEVPADIAPTGNFSESNVTWLGPQAEYQKTIDNMFVGGMRKMLAGGKWGILDATGEWVVAPIYDSIEPEYLVPRSAIFETPLTESTEPLEVLFLDGYTQCVRGGKMGLMNQYGEEVIPCKYDAVGMPSEGLCRIVKDTARASYLGYWSLELGRELVAPNKYVVSGDAATATGRLVVHQMLDKNLIMSGVGGSSNPAAGSATVDYQEVTLPNGDRLAAEHDYMGGYTFVITGAGAPGCLYGTILDKSGKEILPGGPYQYRAGLYPQFGPYMVYCKQSDKPYYAEDGESLGKPYLTGVVGPQGVIIPAQYTGGIRAPIEGLYVGDARMSVIPDLKLVITSKDTTPGKENGGKVGVVNFKNQTVIPFVHDFNYFKYNAEHKIFVGNAPNAELLYTANGKRLNNSIYSSIGTYNDYAMFNGFAQAKKYTETTVNGKYKATHTKCFVNLKTGAEIFPDISDGAPPTSTHFSTTGLVWVLNSQKKWGLINGAGKIVLPYQYDDIADVAWYREKNGYTIVNIGHKQGIVTTAGVQLVPCEYDKLEVPSAHGPVHKEYVEATKDGKMGLLSAITGKLVLPCNFADIGALNSFMYQSEYFNLGVNVVQTGDKQDYCLVNKDGSKVPGSDYQYIDPPHRGLFYTHKYGYIGAEGKVIFPDTLAYSGRKNLVTNDTTLVVKDGKVGYTSTEKLARPTQPKTAAPQKATAAPSSMKLLVNGKPTAVEAYGIRGNNYIKVRDMAYFLNGTDKNFGVTWNAGRNAVELKSNTPYTTVVGDMAKGSAAAKPAARSGNAIYVDGLRRGLTAYAIGGNNFFKLRDVMKVFDVYVGYENGTVTLDTAGSYELTDGEKAGLIPATAETDAPPAAQINKLEVRKSPNLEFYMTGNHTFTTQGFELRYWDEKGVPHAITDPNEMEFKVEGKVIKDGYVFTVSSMKTGTVGYKGLTAPLRFPVYKGVTETEIDKAEGQTDQELAPGNYTLSILGKSVGMSNGWMVIDSKKPVTFGVEKDGDGYYLFIDSVTRNSYIGTDYMNGQLKTTGKQKWRITHLGGDTYSVRQDNKPEMVVNASGQQNKDGTKVIIYKHTGTPKNAIITFKPAK